MSCSHTANKTHTMYTTDNMHSSHRSNAAAYTPCMCDTPKCAVFLWLVVVLVGAYRLYSTVCQICFRPKVPRLTYILAFTFVCCCTEHGQHRPGNNSNSAHSVLTLQLPTPPQPCCPAVSAVGTPCAYGRSCCGYQS